MPELDASYLALIHSGRVSTRTREILLDRAAPDDPAYQPKVLGMDELTLLRAVTARVLPQDAGAIDLAARIDAQLAAGAGDGWRFAKLPADAAAYRAALATLDRAAAALHGAGFNTLPPELQDDMLGSIAAANAAAAPGLLDPAQMAAWFEDLRSDAVRLFVAHPATLARMGYSGIAYGGDGDAKRGFHDIGPGAREPWEPGATP
jgi:hypothetical protein